MDPDVESCRVGELRPEGIGHRPHDRASVRQGRVVRYGSDCQLASSCSESLPGDSPVSELRRVISSEWVETRTNKVVVFCADVAGQVGSMTMIGGDHSGRLLTIERIDESFGVVEE
jgi:hypothetical protein